MSDIDRGRIASDEDRLPWLEPVEEQRAGTPGAGKTIAALLVALLVIGLVVGGIFWLSASRPGGASGDLIAAPEGDYKVKPDQPGGMKVEGEGETAFAASDGRETNASIDLSAIPEAPVSGAGSVTNSDAATGGLAVKPAAPVAVPAPVATAPARPASVAQAAPAPAAPMVGGAQVQLGAFGSEAKANVAWKTLSGRFAFLAALPKSVTPVTVGDKTLYRLRAGAGEQAGSICARLKVAGETCSIIG
jgi:cell division septation protein DedD